MHHQTENDRTGNADQKVKKVETGEQRGKGICKSVPDGEYLCGEVGARCQTERLDQLVKGIDKQHIRKVGKDQFFMFIAARSCL